MMTNIDICSIDVDCDVQSDASPANGKQRPWRIGVRKQRGRGLRGTGMISRASTISERSSEAMLSDRIPRRRRGQNSNPPMMSPFSRQRTNQSPMSLQHEGECSVMAHLALSSVRAMFLT